KDELLAITQGGRRTVQVRFEGTDAKMEAIEKVRALDDAQRGAESARLKASREIAKAAQAELDQATKLHQSGYITESELRRFQAQRDRAAYEASQAERRFAEGQKRADAWKAFDVGSGVAQGLQSQRNAQGSTEKKVRIEFRDAR